MADSPRRKAEKKLIRAIQKEEREKEVAMKEAESAAWYMIQIGLDSDAKIAGMLGLQESQIAAMRSCRAPDSDAPEGTGKVA
jgi:hypothetical protein